MNDTKKPSHVDLIKKDLALCVKIDACTAAKQKIILSWPYWQFPVSSIPLMSKIFVNNFFTKPEITNCKNEIVSVQIQQFCPAHY